MADGIPYHIKQLIERIAEGDERAFTEVFDYYQPKIYTFVWRTTRSASLAEEIVQDSFLKVWLNRKSLPGMENFQGWLNTVASNLTVDALRKLKSNQQLLRAVSQEISHHNSSSFTPTESLLLEKQYAEMLAAAVAELPERQRQAFQLIKQQGLTREQAAVEMGVGSESVKTHLQKALSKIRAYCIARMDALGILLFMWSNR